MKGNNTYKDKGNTKWYYIGQIDVVCPKCSNKAVLKTPNQNQSEPELKCNSCFHSRRGYEYSSFSNIQKILCTKCDSIFDLETKDLSRTIKKVNCKNESSS